MAVVCLERKAFGVIDRRIEQFMAGGLIFMLYVGGSHFYALCILYKIRKEHNTTVRPASRPNFTS
jgi:hypothetical protein